MFSEKITPDDWGVLISAIAFFVFCLGVMV